MNALLEKVTFVIAIVQEGFPDELYRSLTASMKKELVPAPIDGDEGPYHPQSLDDDRPEIRFNVTQYESLPDIESYLGGISLVNVDRVFVVVPATARFTGRRIYRAFPRNIGLFPLFVHPQHADKGSVLQGVEIDVQGYEKAVKNERKTLDALPARIRAWVTKKHQQVQGIGWYWPEEGNEIKIEFPWGHYFD